MKLNESEFKNQTRVQRLNELGLTGRVLFLSSEFVSIIKETTNPSTTTAFLSVHTSVSLATPLFLFPLPISKPPIMDQYESILSLTTSGCSSVENQTAHRGLTEATRSRKSSHTGWLGRIEDNWIYLIKSEEVLLLR